jgi:membrane-associated phospholipid phosphatase
MTIVVLAAVTAVAGIAGWLVARRLPDTEIAAPTLEPRSIAREVAAHALLRRVLRRDPRADVTTAALLVVALVLVVVVAASLSAIWLMIRAEAGLALGDDPVARWAADNAEPWSSDVLGQVSRLGGTGAVVIFSLVVAAIGFRRQPTLAVPLFILLTAGGQFALSNAIKWSVDRARPDLLQLTGHAGTSFPSGHATAAAATYACFALVLGRGRSRRARAALVAMATGITAAVGATRVFLGVHWLTDVIAGTLLGWAWFAVCSIAFGGRILRFGAPIDVAEAAAHRLVER